VLAQYEALHAEREAVGGVRPRALPAAYPTAALLGCVETPSPSAPYPRRFTLLQAHSGGGAGASTLSTASTGRPSARPK
jgi:hypothetical protein